MRPRVLIPFALVVLAVATWWVLRGTGPVDAPESVTADRSSILPKGPRSDFLTARSIGDPIRANERPMISNVGLFDLDGDALSDIVVCDAGRNEVAWIRQFPAGVFTESRLAEVAAAAHAEAVDMDGDGDLDLLVASLGQLLPSNNRIGSVVILENDGAQRFTSRDVVSGIARVADARAGDLDGDGDLDIAVAGFGYDSGETLWLENMGGWRFEPHVLLRLSGPINAIVADVNQDGHLDIVALVSQEWEQIWAFVNDGRGNFRSEQIWGSTNPDYGSSWISLADLDADGDADILYSNGDAFDYAPANSRPWHGVQWLKNNGNMQFEFHRLADISGASSPQAADLDGDGDLDVVVVSAFNRWDDPASQSLMWLENNGREQFALHDVANTPSHLITLAVGDLEGTGRVNLVTGGMHLSRPFDRMSRVTLWSPVER